LITEGTSTGFSLFQLKGLSRKEAHVEAKRYTELLDLVPKTNTLTAKLSGGHCYHCVITMYSYKPRLVC
jgi:ABC-type polar amino acid transport system ATPase subunit